MSMLSDAEVEHVAGCVSAPRAAVDVLTARGYRAYASEGGAHTGGSGPGWHSLLITPGEGGPVGVGSCIASPNYQDLWDEDVTHPDPRSGHRTNMVQNFLRVLDDEKMISNQYMMERHLNHRGGISAAMLSIYLPAWWADRKTEGYPREVAQTILGLLLPPHVATQVEFTEAGLPTMRDFTLFT